MKIIKKLIKWALLLLAIVVGVLLTLWLFNSPTKLSEESQSSIRLENADYKLDSLAISFTDGARSTPALGNFSGKDSRKLSGTVWFPAASEEGVSTHPLLVFSHGFGSYHQGSRHIAQHLARNGYVVAAVDFPLSNMRSPAGSPQLLDIVNQPGDVSAVIDYMLALNQDADSELHQRIDPEKIGAYGLSLGGLTTALVSFHPDFKDDRIKAVAMMAPPLESFSDRFFASNPNVASLILSGNMDRVVPEVENAQMVQARHPQGWFLSMQDGSHLGFANVGNPIRWLDNPDSLGCALMDRMLAELDLPDRWSDVLPNTNSVLIDEVVSPPCPEISGKAMNGLKQQWLTRISIGAFFDLNLRTGERAKKARDFFVSTLSQENPEITLVAPR